MDGFMKKYFCEMFFSTFKLCSLQYQWGGVDDRICNSDGIGITRYLGDPFTLVEVSDIGVP